MEAHKRVSEKGTVEDLLALSKYILKLIQQPIYKNHELFFVKDEEHTQDPPDQGKDDIT